MCIRDSLATIDKNQYALAYQSSTIQYLQVVNSSGTVVQTLQPQGVLIENLGLVNRYLVYSSYDKFQLNLFSMPTYNLTSITKIPLISNLPQIANKITIAPLPLNSTYIAIAQNINRFIGSLGYQTYSNISSLKIPTGISIYNSLDINLHTINGIALSANRLAMIGYKGGIVTQNISTPGSMQSVFQVVNPNNKTLIYSSQIEQNSSASNNVYYQQLFQFADAKHFAAVLSNSTIVILLETFGQVTNTINLGIGQSSQNKCLPVNNDEFLAFICLDYNNKKLNLYSSSSNFGAKSITSSTSTILDFTIDSEQDLVVYATDSQILSASFTI
eukprot:TRINITY_DN455_c0_g1_i1.p2 TRINITY_DN455_c0_g1~~TRINITY_DN455_c0_g1_i1.p2  ORF type:complete len:330 (-),score=22.70 TRINITY_DN455_c0_g1_i1:93-1082(-)